MILWKWCFTRAASPDPLVRLSLTLIHTPVSTYKALYVGRSDGYGAGGGIDILAWCIRARLRFMSWSSLIHFKKATNGFVRSIFSSVHSLTHTSREDAKRAQTLEQALGILIYDSSGYKYICDVKHNRGKAKSSQTISHAFRALSSRWTSSNFFPPRGHETYVMIRAHTHTYISRAQAFFHAATYYIQRAIVWFIEFHSFSLHRLHLCGASCPNWRAHKCGWFRDFASDAKTGELKNDGKNAPLGSNIFNLCFINFNNAASPRADLLCARWKTDSLRMRKDLGKGLRGLNVAVARQSSFMTDEAGGIEYFN